MENSGWWTPYWPHENDSTLFDSDFGMDSRSQRAGDRLVVGSERIPKHPDRIRVSQHARVDHSPPRKNIITSLGIFLPMYLAGSPPNS